MMWLLHDIRNIAAVLYVSPARRLVAKSMWRQFFTQHRDYLPVRACKWFKMQRLTYGPDQLTKVRHHPAHATECDISETAIRASIKGLLFVCDNEEGARQTKLGYLFPFTRENMEQAHGAGGTCSRPVRSTLIMNLRTIDEKQARYSMIRYEGGPSASQAYLSSFWVKAAVIRAPSDLVKNFTTVFRYRDVG